MIQPHYNGHLRHLGTFFVSASFDCLFNAKIEQVMSLIPSRYVIDKFSFTPAILKLNIPTYLSSNQYWSVRVLNFASRAMPLPERWAQRYAWIIRTPRCPFSTRLPNIPPAFFSPFPPLVFQLCRILDETDIYQNDNDGDREKMNIIVDNYQ